MVCQVLSKRWAYTKRSRRTIRQKVKVKVRGGYGGGGEDFSAGIFEAVEVVADHGPKTARARLETWVRMGREGHHTHVNAGVDRQGHEVATPNRILVVITKIVKPWLLKLAKKMLTDISSVVSVLLVISSKGMMDNKWFCNKLNILQR